MVNLRFNYHWCRPILQPTSAIFITLVVIALVTLSSHSLALTITADRNTIPLNESLTLSISSTHSGLDNIDLAPISQNFKILNRSSQNEFSMVNGKTRSLQKLLLTLEAKKTGTFVIPAFTHKRQSSQPLSIEVTAAKTPPTQFANESIFIESTLDKTNAYIGEQLIYTLAIYYKIGLSSAELSELDVPEADAFALEDKTFQRDINGQRYQIVEKRYALFFKQDGVFTIPAQTLNASVGQNTRSRFGFDPFSRGKRIKLAAKAIDIAIKSPPVGGKTPIQTGAQWLPAEQLELKESWSNLENSTVGEPLTRNIRLFAKGLAAETLPELPQTNVPNLNSYPEKPEFSNHQWHGGLAGTREQSVVYIPTKAGAYSFPELNIHWWNTQSEQWQLATLPARTVQIKASISNDTHSEMNKPASLPANNPDKTPALNLAETIDQPMQQQETQQGYWKLSTLLLLGLWLITAFLLWRLWRSKDVIRPPLTQPTDNELKYFDTITKSLLTNYHSDEPSSLLNALTHWHRALDKIMDHTPLLKSEPELQALILELNNKRTILNQSLYSQIQENTEKDVDLASTIKAIATKLHKMLPLIQRRDKHTKHLQPLYPGPNS